MFRKFIFNIKWFILDTFDPRNSCCRLAGFYTFLKKAYQICTFWEGHCRELLRRVNENYGKLLETGLYFNKQRTRHKRIIYYTTKTNIFCRVKVYKTEYIKKGKNINLFINIVQYLLKEDEELDYTEKVECIYSGWGFTKNQCITALKTIRKLTKDLDWEEGVCTEHRAYTCAKTALDYLNKKEVYFTLKPTDAGYTVESAIEENEKGLREQIYLISRDLKDRYKYCYRAQNLMYKVLEKQTTERDTCLKKELKELLKEFDKEGYISFYSLYHF